MNDNVIIYKVVARVRNIYTCDTCGKRELGDTRELTSNSFEGVTEDAQRLRAHCMPVGWSSHGFHNGKLKFICQAGHHKEPVR